MNYPSIHPYILSKKYYIPYIFNLNPCLDGWNIRKFYNSMISQLQDDDCVVIKSPMTVEFNINKELLDALLHKRMRRFESSIRVYTKNHVYAIPLSFEAIDDLAHLTGITSGKWLLYVDSNDVDDVWSNVASATSDGRLGYSSALRSRTDSEDTFVINVNTYDYFDYDDLLYVLEGLDRIRYEAPLCYKPDIYTLLGIYHGDPKIKPCR